MARGSDLGFGAKTTVPVSRTKAALEELLLKHGATAYMTMVANSHSQVAFCIEGRNIRLQVPVPLRADFQHTKTGRRRDAKQADTAWRQACRQRWRATWLLIRAKLEAISMGETSVDREFLHDMLAGDPRNNITFGELLEQGEIDPTLQLQAQLRVLHGGLIKIKVGGHSHLMATECLELFDEITSKGQPPLLPAPRRLGAAK